jgi:hypothetical protein
VTIAANLSADGRLSRRVVSTALATGLLWVSPSGARGASLSAQDLRVIGRALAFLRPQPTSDTVLGVAYATEDPASRADAEAIAALIGEGLKVGNAVLQPKLVDTGTLARGGFRVVIAAAGANGPQLSAATRTMRALCATADLAAVQAGYCTMAITSEPRVEIVVNHTAAAAAGVEFAVAFRMTIREI